MAVVVKIAVPPVGVRRLESLSRRCFRQVVSAALDEMLTLAKRLIRSGGDAAIADHLRCFLELSLAVV
jgi:hypothetical protein